jgi:hypothetical protein
VIKKYFFYWLFFCTSFTIEAQNAVVKPKVKIDSIIKIDTSGIVQKKFPKNFQSKYKSREFVYEEKAVAKNAWERFKEWISQYFANLFRVKNPEKAYDILGTIFYVICAIIIIIAIFMIVKLVLNKEGKWIFGKNASKKIIQFEEIEKNLKITDFEKLIKETINNGSNKLAVRYYYLWLLKKMSENEIIDWNIEKTNCDYIYEIQNLKIKENFSYLSYLYNNIWYGDFDIDQNVFDKAKSSFENAIKNSNR